jgi:hypothetical protein
MKLTTVTKNVYATLTIKESKSVHYLFTQTNTTNASFALFSYIEDAVEVSSIAASSLGIGPLKNFDHFTHC